MATICKQKSHKNGTAFRQLRKLCAAVASHEEQAAKVREIQSQLAVSTGKTALSSRTIIVATVCVVRVPCNAG